ncbi:hypothetical protein AN643_04325 [Candidatus Epulonipiscioides saccharophilum]|nr:hypothetical protein AN643_04325 [Epulopiscium sp. SCG-B10WGA-EpuloB]
MKAVSFSFLKLYADNTLALFIEIFVVNIFYVKESHASVFRDNNTVWNIVKNQAPTKHLSCTTSNISAVFK